LAKTNVSGKKKFFITVLYIILTLTVVYFILFQTSIFKINKIQVVGNENLSYNYIKNFSGIVEGENIFKIKPKEVEKILLKNPYIKTCSVIIKYPSTVEIKIKERKIIAQVLYDKINYLMIDKEGVVVKEGQYDPDLLLIKGIKIHKYKIGEKISSDFDGSIIANILALLKQNDLYKEITYINYDKILLETKRGINIVFDRPDDINYSLKCTEIILKDLIDKGYNKGTIEITGNNNPVFLP